MEPDDGQGNPADPDGRYGEWFENADDRHRLATEVVGSPLVAS